MSATRRNAGDVLEGSGARLLEEVVSRFTPPEAAKQPATSSAVEAADRDARHWTSMEVGPLTPGSVAHKRAICAMFEETFNPYRPSVIAWPTLGPDELRRLRSLPIWDIAVQTEGRARLSFAAFADALDDPAMRSTIMLNAWEEDRHKEVLSHLVRTYGIELAEEPAYLTPRDREFAFLVTGYSESIDSFFAFGLFELAKRSGFFPPELVETFEPVIQEECRHILLFANWLADPVRAARRGCLGLHRGAARRARTERGHQHEGLAAGKQFHGQWRAGRDVGRDRIPRSDADLRGGKRPATGGLRPASVPADPGSRTGAVCARGRQALAGQEALEHDLLELKDQQRPHPEERPQAASRSGRSNLRPLVGKKRTLAHPSRGHPPRGSSG